jgi:hypothetical protein
MAAQYAAQAISGWLSIKLMTEFVDRDSVKNESFEVMI